jgi:hypothetical protein
MKFNLKELRNGRIFNVTFTKADGSLRRMNARLGVKKYTNGKGLKYNTLDAGNLIVFSMNDKGYRTVKIKNILEIKCNGKVYTTA